MNIMASEQTNTNEAISYAVVEAARAAILAMAAARTERTQNVGPRLERHIMKQPTFNWEAEVKYNELKNTSLEVNNISNLIAYHKQNRQQS